MTANKMRDVRLTDLSAFLVVQRLGSVTGAARQLGSTPSQVSKAVSRLESQLGTVLFLRNSHGVNLTEAGRRILPRLDDLVSRMETLQRGDEPRAPVMVIAAPSFMNTAFLPTIANACPDLRVRGLDLPPALVRAYASENFFDATICIGPPRLTDAWTSLQIGHCRSALFASPRLAKTLGKQPVSPEALRELPFVSPVYNVNGQSIPVDDACPLPRGMRRDGHEVQTIGLALDLAQHTDQLVFGPAFAASEHVRRRLLVEVEVRTWSVVAQVYFACNVDRVLARMQTAIVQALKERSELLEQLA